MKKLSFYEYKRAFGSNCEPYELIDRYRAYRKAKKDTYQQ